MNKNIVIFGCDNSGKTTLCQRLQYELSDKYNVKIAKSIGPKKRIEEYVGFMDENLSENCVTIFDRFPIIEEATTGIVLRHENIFDKVVNQKEFYDKYLGMVDLFIYCYPGVDNILRFGEREQMNGIIENIQYLIPSYLQYFLMLKRYKYNVFEYNYSIDNMCENESYWNHMLDIIKKEII